MTWGGQNGGVTGPGRVGGIGEGGLHHIPSSALGLQTLRKVSRT